METVSTRTWIILALLTAAVYAAGLFIPVMDIDAATYAFMSRQIAENSNFWKSLLEPQGFLDKPPLLFFLSSLSFKLFGVSNVAYKLPSFLATLLGFYSTFRLGVLLYDKRTGILSACMLCCSQAFIFFTNDVRTDALLAGAVIFAIWQITAFLKKKKIRYFLGSGCGLAFAMLAKGPIGFMVPALAIGSYLVAMREWRILFKWYWLPAILLIGTILSPMLVGLYHQYGWYGIRFFFWTQSFGRITGESHWNNGSDHFFFVHTFLWAFLPWAFVAYYGIVERCITSVKRRCDVRCAADLLLLGGTIFPFIALSFSHYKLPHYIFVFFPLTAILTARTVLDILDRPGRKGARILLFTQLGCCALGWAFCFIILTLVFPCNDIITWLIGALMLLLTGYSSLPRHSIFRRAIISSFFAILGVNLLLNIWFYPHLLSFQGGSTAAKILQQHHAPLTAVRTYRAGGASVNFYTGIALPAIDSAGLAEAVRSKELWIYTDSAGNGEIAKTGALIRHLDSFPNFGVTTVTPKFLYFKTRPRTVRTFYVVHTAPVQNPALNFGSDKGMIRTSQ
jgi:4-amino-4-deoxy-L-arabinose transferase-like glycosyltransferase